MINSTMAMGGKCSESRSKVACSKARLPSLVAGLAISSFVLVFTSLPPVSPLENAECDTVTKLHSDDLDLKIFQDSSWRPNYYRYLTADLESNFLFVGAMNRIYGLYLNNIENKAKRVKQDFYPDKKSIKFCKISGKRETPDCQNHVRFLVRNKTMPNLFYMCATGAENPVSYQLKLQGNQFIKVEDEMQAYGICPYDPADNTTVVLIEDGTPGNIPALFAGSVTDSIKSDPIIVRKDLYRPDGTLESGFVRTTRNRNDWLNEPQFVGSFGVGDYVYFFFREVAIEFTNCGKKIYSRIARVCKNDYGGTSYLKNNWISFSKARLNCSIPGDYPYYFDEIQDVYRIGDYFYGLFTTNVNGLTASAICRYNLRDINRAFGGSFKEQKDEKSLWLPVSENKVPKPRPGNCTVTGRMSKRGHVPHEYTNFVSSAVLMDKAVAHEFGKPIFYQSNCLLLKFVAVQNVAGQDDTVFFAAANNGVIYKIAEWPGLTDLDVPKTYVVSQFIPFENKRRIWSMLIHEKWLYFGTDMAVGQINVETCDKYNKIDLCIYDPYCGWDTVLGECRTYNHNSLINYAKIDLLSYPLEEAIRKRVGQLYYDEKISKISGSSVTLKIEYLLHIRGSVVWTKNGSHIVGSRHILAQDNSLIVTDLRKADEGIYKAKDGAGRIVAEYTLSVETSKDQIEQRWMRKFDQWCDEFERYQEDIRQWERKCSSCCKESSISKMVPALGGK